MDTLPQMLKTGFASADKLHWTCILFTPFTQEIRPPCEILIYIWEGHALVFSFTITVTRIQQLSYLKVSISVL